MDIEALSPSQRKIYETIEQYGRISRKDLCEKTRILSKHISRDIKPLLKENLIGYQREGRAVEYFLQIKQEKEQVSHQKPLKLTHFTSLKVRENQGDHILNILKREQRPVSRQEVIEEIGGTGGQINRDIYPKVSSGEIQKITKRGKVYYVATGIELKPDSTHLTEIDLVVQKVPVLEAFLNFRKYGQRKSEKSVALYAYKIVGLYRYLSKGDKLRELRRIETISQHDIEHYVRYLIEEREVADRTVANIVAILRTYFKWCKDEGYITINPAERVPIPSYEEKEQVDFSAKEFRKMIDVAGSFKNKVLLHFLLFTGARVSEVVATTLDDIKWETAQIWIAHGKGKKTRKIRLQKKVLEMLRRYIREYRAPREAKEQAIFINHVGTQLKDQIIREVITKIRIRAGIQKNITPHSFRRAFGRLLYEQGVPLRVIQVLLGHSNINTTIKYVRASDKFVREWYDIGSDELFKNIWNEPSTSPAPRNSEPLNLPI